MTGLFPVGRRGRHVYLYQAFASSEQFSARRALFRRCCVVADTANSVRHASNDHPAGFGGACFTGAASCSGGAAGRTTNRTERLYSHRHGHGAHAPTHRDGKAGCARSGHDTAPTDAHSDGNPERDPRGATGCDVAVQPAPCVIEHHH